MQAPAITRRQALQGMGALLSLPFLESWVNPAEPEKAEKLHSPMESVALALVDAASLPIGVQCCARYLSIYNIPAVERELWKAVLDFVLNSLSRHRVLTRSVAVAGSDGTVLRFFITDYGLDPHQLDEVIFLGSGPLRSISLVEKAEPYFYQDVPGKRSQYQTISGPWLPVHEFDGLKVATHSLYPIARGDWFLYHAMLPPAYYDLLGFKTLADFQAFVRFRNQDSKDLAIQAIGLDSQEVALNNRFLLRSPTVLGTYHETGDFNDSVDEKDLLRDILKRKRDASEIIANGLNGLLFYFLINGQDVRIDFADPNVASDRNTPWKNKLVWTGASCIMCHTKGWKDVADEVRILSRKNIALFVQDQHDAQQIIDLFTPDFDASILADQENYNRVVLACTDRTALIIHKAFARMFVDYIQSPVSLDMLPAETGYPLATILDVLKRSQNVDHTLTGFLQKPPRAARRDQFEASGFAQLMLLLQAGGPPP